MRDSGQPWFEPVLFQHLPPEECRELLAAKSVGRVAFNGPDGPQVLPVNYVVHRRSIFFRTAAGSALGNAMRNTPVAFEIDDIDEVLQSGWSVVAVGEADLVDDPDLLVELWETKVLSHGRSVCERNSYGSPDSSHRPPGPPGLTKPDRLADQQRMPWAVRCAHSRAPARATTAAVPRPRR